MLRAVIAAAWLLVPGCQPHPGRPAMTHDAPTDRESLRAELVAGQHRLAGRDDYAVTDPAYLDEFLDRALAATPHRADPVARAGALLQSALHARDGLARIESLVAARYARPKITVQGDTVTVDVGVIPGQLGHLRGGYFLGASPLVEANEWKSTEAARVLDEAA